MNFEPDYTPKNIDEFVFCNARTEAIARAIISGNLLLPKQGTTGLFCSGPVGTGKTTFAKLMPIWIEQARGGSDPFVDFYACGEGDDHGRKLIEGIRKKMDVSPNWCSGLGFYVLDEVDRLEPKIMKSLAGVMNANRSVFILTTNYPSKIDRSVIDRCYELEFTAPPAEKWLPLARRIAADCGVDADDTVLLPICRKSGGSARYIYREVALLGII
jgi:DNA polymerase III delta prime subunit